MRKPFGAKAVALGASAGRNVSIDRCVSGCAPRVSPAPKAITLSPSYVRAVATPSQQNWRLEANRREQRRMVTDCLTNTKCARTDVYERPRTAIQGLAAPFPSHFCRRRLGRAWPMGKAAAQLVSRSEKQYQ